MLLGAALIGWGSHFLAKNGNCSSTGYVSYGPVPKCSGGEALYILSVFFLGPALAIVGWLMAQTSGVLWPAVCVAVGIGMITLYADTSSASGARTFGLVAGILFFALAVLSVVRTVQKRNRPKPAVMGPAGLATAPAPETPTADTRTADRATAGRHPVSVQPMTPASPDPRDRIAKLAAARQRRAHQRGVRGPEGQAARRDVTSSGGQTLKQGADRPGRHRGTRGPALPSRMIMGIWPMDGPHPHDHPRCGWGSASGIRFTVRFGGSVGGAGAVVNVCHRRFPSERGCGTGIS